MKNGSRCRNIWAGARNMGICLAQLTSSRSQRHAARVGGSSSQRIGTGQFSHEAFHKKTSGCPAGWVPSMLSRESARGFVFLVPCFSEQPNIGRKNSFGGSPTFLYFSKLEVFMKNRTSMSGHLHFSPCTTQKGH